MKEENSTLANKTMAWVSFENNLEKRIHLKNWIKKLKNIL